MRYTYTDYTPEMACVIDSWLDTDGRLYTGLDDGMASFYDYWIRDDHTIPGKNFWVKIVCENHIAVGVIALALVDGVVLVSEMLIDPAKRGNGIGSSILRELLEHGEEVLGMPIVMAEACIYPSNISSQKAFENAGFGFDHAHPDGDIWYYRYKKDL